MSALQFTCSVKQDSSLIISNATETISLTGMIINAGNPGVVVPSGTYNQPVSCLIDHTKLQALFITTSGQVTLSTNGTNAVQSLTITGSPTGGTFTVTYATITSAAIPYNATAAQVQTALQGMTSIGAGNVTVTGSAGGPWTLTFGGQLGVQPVTTVTASGAGLTPSGGVTPASVTSGVNPAQTWTIPAGSVLAWSAQDGFFSNPISADITKLNLTNTQGAALTFWFIAGLAA